VDRDISRRRLLKGATGLGVAAVVPLAAGCTDDESTGDADGTTNADDPGAAGPSPFGDVAADATVFAHGVASGDPTHDSVVLWTRITVPDSATTEVTWELASDADFSEVVASGTTATGSDRDHTVKVDPGGLEAGTDYHYRFVLPSGPAGGAAASPTGRTRTSPSGAVESLRFGVVSCSHFGFGHFHAYRHLAERDDLDVVLHLGDYIYEYGADGGFPSTDDRLRAELPEHEIVSLDDYRTRYAAYRTDPDLQLLHQRVPFVTVWDDHETANNSWRDGAGEHDESTQGPWSKRRAAATQAYFEWLPIRENPDDLLYRRIAFGDLVDLIMLDTRIVGRDQQSESIVVDASDPDLPDDLLGVEQEEWLFDQLSDSEAKWRVLGQQVVMGLWKLGPGAYANSDQWNGYPAARSRLLSHVQDNDIDNIVVLTGDVHSSWAIDVTDDNVPYDAETGDGSIAVEFVAPGVTSPAGATLAAFVDGIQPTSPHVKWADADHNGFIVLDVDHERTRGTWFFVEGVSEGERGLEQGPSYEVRSGVPTLTAASD
jgi:alkaline phosphatase D